MPTEPRFIIISATFSNLNENESMLKIAISALSLSLMLTGSTQASETLTEHTEQARKVTQKMAKTLMGEVATAMKAGGPLNVIEVCRSRAVEIADEVSQESGWQVSRTSKKLRNPANQADVWENAVLNQFDKRLAAGEAAKKIDFAEVVETNGQKTFRYMKAIPTGQVCLSCHGNNIPAEIAEKLDAYYPADQARGYELGMIRGAFTLQKDL